MSGRQQPHKKGAVFPMKQKHLHCVLWTLGCVMPVLAAPPVFFEAGTELTVWTNNAIDSTTSHAGDQLHGVLAGPVEVDEDVILPKGEECILTITSIKDSGRLKGRASMTFQLTGIVFDGRLFRLKSAAITHRGEARLGDTAKVAGTGAAIGAVLGSIGSGGGGAAIGAGVGAAVGTGLTAVLPKRKIVIPAETQWTFTLEESVLVGGAQ
jgi:hypothetical protein